MRLLLLFLIIPVFNPFCTAQAKKFVRKAENSIDRGNLRDAITRYEKALAAKPDDLSANMELGLLYSELLDNYPKAEPHLEKVYSLGSNDSLYDVIFALGKCYHYRGDFDKALSFFDRLRDVQDLEKETDFQKELEKRKKDCEYAKANAHKPVDENIYLVNCGKNINSDMPEYVPVLTAGNNLLFTSKRKDDKNEELNYLDGKFFESMYISTITVTGFSPARRYTLPDNLMNSKFYKHHQAVVSLSQDGKKLFTFKDSKLYEIGVDEREKQEPTEVKINQFNHYQNHAFLTADGNTLYFTSDVPGGYGGTDIYRSEKNAKGEWSNPQNLGEPVNTSFDEDAPFVAADGTLYFASKGHEGYGNYDIFKTYLSEGKWTQPENLGAPINSTGHDIFMVFDSTSSNGFFSSGKPGGYGDMDIYRIVFLDKMDKSCPLTNLWPAKLSIEDRDTSDFKNIVRLDLPSNYRLLASEWNVAGKNLNLLGAQMENDYGKAGSYPVKLKAILGCDTCMSPLVSCLEISNKIEKQAPPVLASKNPEDEKDRTGEGIKKSRKDEDSGIASGKTTGESERNAGGDRLREDTYFAPVLFSFNGSTLIADETSVLKKYADQLKAAPRSQVSIFGYADARGSDAVNLRISQQRAEVVKNYLLRHGVKPSQVKEVKGKGATAFLNECEKGVDCGEEKHRLNRRTEIIVVN